MAKTPKGVAEYMAQIGRRGGKVKGPKGFSVMTPEQRSEIAAKAAAKRWEKPAAASAKVRSAKAAKKKGT